MFTLRRQISRVRAHSVLSSRQASPPTSRAAAACAEDVDVSAGCAAVVQPSGIRLFSSPTSRTGSGNNNKSTKPFDKVLIANRGEIACRVARTCRRLGIRTVGIYSDADGPGALHASVADEAYRIGVGPSPAESYLRGDEVLEIALQSGAQAIHPGYGFLSENSTFATSVSDSDLTFIGPPPSAILAMGSKSHSKSIMEEANVPTTPGYHGTDQDPERLLHEAVHNVGFPLLIKATMGGGGKGMRLVHSSADFLEALESCKRESASAFGDTSVILERYLVNPRHVEVQIVADTHGNVVHLYERDCSLQRRHQKIIEEAPASDLPDEVRKDIGAKAVLAARAVGYVNAGTVEFLLDTESPNKSHDFYFCEMNTRLQVEHPITELITGQDLVEWQLRVASGEELPIVDQDEIPCMGHAFEARIYAENPMRDFLPATGHVWHHCPPAEPNSGVDEHGVRVDTSIRTGQDITVHYDPMISKLIVHGPNRTDALQKLIRSLKQYQIAGVPTNIPFLIKCAEHPTFGMAGEVNTGFLDRHANDVMLVDGKNDGDEHAASLNRAVASVVVLLIVENRVGVVGNIDSARRRHHVAAGGPWSNLSGSWRMGGRGGRHRRVLTLLDDDDGDGDGDSCSPTIECWSNPDGSFEVTVAPRNGAEEHGADGGAAGDTYTIDGRLDDGGRMDIIVDGIRHMSFSVVVREDVDGGTISVHVWAKDGEEVGTDYAWDVTFAHPLPTASSSSAQGRGGANAVVAGSRLVKAPMPGKIVRLNAEVGTEVKGSDAILVMEAMKMEHAIPAPGDGRVTEIRCEVGDIVNDGSVLAIIKDAGAGTNEEQETAAL